jgi:hypothetical protein
MQTGPENDPAIQRYLTNLQESLRRRRLNPDEGLADAREFLQAEWESLVDDGRLSLAESELHDHLVRTFGSPEEVAAEYAAAAQLVEESAAESAAGLADRETLPPAAGSPKTAPGRLRMVWAGAIAAGAATVAMVAIWLALGSAGRHAAASAPQDRVIWADGVVAFEPGIPHSTLSNEPGAALGPPDFRDDLAESKQYHAYVTLGRGGRLVLEFTQAPFCDGAGPDLKIFEVGPLAEPVIVAVSVDGREWIEVGRTKSSDNTIDLAAFVRPDDRFRFVRLTDARGVRAKDNQWPGADIDAVCALHTERVE